MIDKDHQKLSTSRQCRLLAVNRSSLYYASRPRPCKKDLELMRWIDELFMNDPTVGSRTIQSLLRRDGYPRINRKRIQRLMRRMGLQAIYPRPKTTRRHPQHKVYPYRLRNLTIDRPNKVWAADITYIPMHSGFM